MLGISDEKSLLTLAKKFQQAGIRHSLIQEVDPPFTNQFTAIGIEPVQDRSEIKKYLQKLRLYGEAPKGVKCEETQSSPPFASVAQE